MSELSEKDIAVLVIEALVVDGVELVPAASPLFELPSDAEQKQYEVVRADGSEE